MSMSLWALNNPMDMKAMGFSCFLPTRSNSTKWDVYLACIFLCIVLQIGKVQREVIRTTFCNKTKAIAVDRESKNGIKGTLHEICYTHWVNYKSPLFLFVRKHNDKVFKRMFALHVGRQLNEFSVYEWFISLAEMIGFRFSIRIRSKRSFSCQGFCCLA